MIDVVYERDFETETFVVDASFSSVRTVGAVVADLEAALLPHLSPDGLFLPLGAEPLIPLPEFVWLNSDQIQVADIDGLTHAELSALVVEAGSAVWWYAVREKYLVESFPEGLPVVWTGDPAILRQFAGKWFEFELGRERLIFRFNEFSISLSGYLGVGFGLRGHDVESYVQAGILCTGSFGVSAADGFAGVPPRLTLVAELVPVKLSVDLSSIWTGATYEVEYSLTYTNDLVRGDGKPGGERWITKTARGWNRSLENPGVQPDQHHGQQGQPDAKQDKPDAKLELGLTGDLGLNSDGDVEGGVGLKLGGSSSSGSGKTELFKGVDKQGKDKVALSGSGALECSFPTDPRVKCRIKVAGAGSVNVLGPIAGGFYWQSKVRVVGEAEFDLARILD